MAMQIFFCLCTSKSPPHTYDKLKRCQVKQKPIKLLALPQVIPANTFVNNNFLVAFYFPQKKIQNTHTHRRTQVQIYTNTHQRQDTNTPSFGAMLAESASEARLNIAGIRVVVLILLTGHPHKHTTTQPQTHTHGSFTHTHTNTHTDTGYATGAWITHTQRCLLFLRFSFFSFLPFLLVLVVIIAVVAVVFACHGVYFWFLFSCTFFVHSLFPFFSVLDFFLRNCISSCCSLSMTPPLSLSISISVYVSSRSLCTRISMSIAICIY